MAVKLKDEYATVKDMPAPDCPHHPSCLVAYQFPRNASPSILCPLHSLAHGFALLWEDAARLHEKLGASKAMGQQAQLLLTGPEKVPRIVSRPIYRRS